MTTSTTTSTTTEASPATTAIVIELQQVMTQLGYYDGPIDGVYGQGTIDGVKAMQTDLGVTADGIYGAETHNALKGKGDAHRRVAPDRAHHLRLLRRPDRRRLRRGDDKTR